MRPCSRFDWERLLRRAQALSPEAQGTGLILATYADQDGSRVRPGVMRLAVVRRRSEPTVKRHIRELVDLGLLQLIRRGGGFGEHARANEYRLTMPVEARMLALDLLDPDEAAADMAWSEVTQITDVLSSGTQITDVPSSVEPAEPIHANSDHPRSELRSLVHATQITGEPLPTHLPTTTNPEKKPSPEPTRARAREDAELLKAAMPKLGDRHEQRIDETSEFRPLFTIGEVAFEGGILRHLDALVDAGHIVPDWYRGNADVINRVRLRVHRSLLAETLNARRGTGSSRQRRTA